MILSCSVPLETDWHVSFLENVHSHPAPGNQRFEITMGWGVKTLSFYPLHFGVLKMRLDDSIPNRVSGLKSDNM